MNGCLLGVVVAVVYEGGRIYRIMKQTSKPSNSTISPPTHKKDSGVHSLPFILTIIINNMNERIIIITMNMNE